MKLIDVIKISGFLALGSVYAQNIVPSSEWQVGTATDALTTYVNSGPAATNVNERGSLFLTGQNPRGDNATLWHVNSDVAEQNYTRYYGFKTTVLNGLSIDPEADYRYSVWVKMIGADATTQNGIFSAGVKGVNYTFNYGGNPTTQIQWRSGGSVPSGPINNEWFLMVAYVNGRNSTKIFSDGGMYDTDGNNVGPLGAGTPRFDATASPNFELFTHLRFNPGTDQSLVFFDPRFEEVNGQEPSIEELATGVMAGGGLWSANSNGVHYNSGNVGIGTDDPGTDWKLAVNGKIRSKEIKVETGWADYVFEDNYPLPTLEEVQKHITEKGHLMNIPSATEVEANGIELGEMNRLLLEKIEELTLYTLQQQEELELLRKQLEILAKKKEFN